MSEWTTIDKAGWPDGPWQSEPDKRVWVDELTGLDCMVNRAPRGHLCGYVGVAEGHPWFERYYGDLGVDVHGGLTYADFCQEGEPEGSGIYHAPEPGRPSRVWWLGFDCMHMMDLSPKPYGVPALDDNPYPGAAYRVFAYVAAEVASLAEQAHNALSCVGRDE